MKRTFVVLVTAIIFPFIFTGCSAFLGGKLHKEYDEFMGAKKATLSQIVREKDRKNGIEDAEITYLFETRNNVENVEVYFAVSKVPETMIIDRTAYIKVDENMYEVPVIMFRHFRDQNTSVQSDMIFPPDSVISGMKSKTTDLETYNVEKFNLHMTSEAIESIRKGGKLSFRFYFGPDAATYNIRGIKMTKVRRLLKK